ncbi:hypothetical protein [Aliivibrio fischeri]|uniref:Uncharacterized protein n=1 Tax=Aliivibrio fischeri TaxID=668 RepID=A0A510UMH3_ALIFS|nr:hypothetical protein [Aliivibrio fischeri]GEK15862.1 hypothetical protein AFI02nite_38980 [Aliivibrio fischeri]
MLSHLVMHKIADIADLASKESGTSYEEYIRLFSISFDKEFKQYRSIHEVTRFKLERN